MNDYYECGDGWIPLIEEAKTIVSKYNLKHPNLEFPLEFVQIKEKWGLLCFNLNQYIPEINGRIKAIEGKSAHVCENCGTKENVTREHTHGWIMTLCNKCRKEEIEKYNKRYDKQ